jgi:hypothetical protein
MGIELKDWVLFVLGIIVGLLAGIAIYWLPLSQFLNECKSLFNLATKRYPVGTPVTVRAGAELKPLENGTRIGTGFISQDANMKVWHDEGIGWFHTASGWSRSRILHVYFPLEGVVQPVYKICHLDLIECSTGFSSASFFTKPRMDFQLLTRFDSPFFATIAFNARGP